MPGFSRIVKHTVVSSGLHDADIRPPALLGEFKRLSLRDAAAFFPASDSLEDVPCPACGLDGAHPAFLKDGFTFARCGGCQSLYVSPRPRADLLARYFEGRADALARPTLASTYETIVDDLRDDTQQAIVTSQERG